jgi:hypothetical protein
MTNRITQEQEEALRAAEKAATPGPWVNGTEPEDDDNVRVCFFRDGKACEWCIALSGDMEDGHWTEETQRRWRADADFIAAARQGVPALLAELDALREWKKDVERLVREIGEAACGRGFDRLPKVLKAVNASLDAVCGVSNVVRGFERWRARKP